MSRNNLEKIKQIDKLLGEYAAKVHGLKIKRNNIISDFVSRLRDKKIKDIRDSIK